MGNPGGRRVRAEEEIAIGGDERQQKSKMKLRFPALAVWALFDGIKRERSTAEDQKPK
jgi:hypothetical protein